MGRMRKTHDALRNINAVADNIGLAVDISNQFYRSQINTDAEAELIRNGSFIGINQRALQKITHMHADKQRVFGVAQKADCGTITGIQNNSLVNGHVLQCFRKDCGEAIFHRDLFGNRFF